MTIDIDPQAIDGLLPWTTLLTIAGASSVIAWMLRRASTFSLTPRMTYGIALRVVLWSLLGGRLFHVIDHIGFYADVPFQAFYLWNGGQSLWGALIVGAGGALWHAKRSGADLRAFAQDLTLAGLAVVVAGRLGDFIAGERLGTGTSLPWAVSYANERSVSFGVGGAHPVALYEALLAAVMLVVLVRFRHRLETKWPGSTIDIGFAGYAAGRFLIGFATVNDTTWGFGFSQWLALIVLAVIGLYAFRGSAWSRMLGARTKTKEHTPGDTR
jgi:prolipoprotein diacylglyceryltransferase